MGRIKRFNLSRLMQQHQASFFFETGTWRGDGLAYAAKHPFKKLYSSEIIESIAQTAQKRFSTDNRVEIITDSSIDALRKTLASINGNCIFWLDAHFPGAEEGLKSYNEVDEESIKLPLQTELEIISARKAKYQDVILIDDLRIYEEGNYDSGNLPDSVIPPKVRNTDFAYELFDDTHTVLKFYKDEGYLVLLPKKTNPLSFAQTSYFKIYNSLFKKLL